MFSRLLDWNLSGNLCTHSDTADRKCSLQMLTNTCIIIHCKEFRRVYWKCCEKLRLQYKSLDFHGMKSSPCISPPLLLKFQYWKAHHCCTFRPRSTELCDFTGRIKEQKRQEIIIRENHHKVWIQTKAKNWLRKGTKGMQRGILCSMCSSQHIFSSPVLESSITKESISYDKSRLNQVTLCEHFFLQFKRL